MKQPRGDPARYVIQMGAHLFRPGVILFNSQQPDEQLGKDVLNEPSKCEDVLANEMIRSLFDGMVRACITPTPGNTLW